MVWLTESDSVFLKISQFLFGFHQKLIHNSNFLTKQSWETASNVVLKRYKDDVDTGNEFQAAACIVNIKSSAVVMLAKNVGEK